VLGMLRMERGVQQYGCKQVAEHASLSNQSQNLECRNERDSLRAKAQTVLES
jgi:hypothetical protein